MVFRSIRALACAFAVLLGTSAAAVASELEVKLETFRVIATDNGREALEATTVLRPGETLEYRATYLNRSESTLRAVQGIVPIPVGMHYLPDFAAAQGIEASLDGETYAPVPLQRIDPKTNETQTVPFAEYRFLRFPLGDIAPEAAATAAARVTIPVQTASTN